MPYVIRTYDSLTAPNCARTRPAHLAYLLPYARILAAGGFRDDGSVGTGSLIVFDTEDRAGPNA